MKKRPFGMVGYLASISTLGLVGGAVAAPEPVTARAYCEENGCVQFGPVWYCEEGFYDLNCYRYKGQCWEEDCEIGPPQA